ncbi:hypothetical protein [Methylovulum sp.]|uniref:hypothetical protein n=1 Tax=Methylovulum sp. TaxID=1916980 RepID=UPI0026143F51|nr:hypothetical protein [Methylovulum sp.]MDD5124334.1 hypothetical protein [Methylovulum sp.]
MNHWGCTLEHCAAQQVGQKDTPPLGTLEVGFLIKVRGFAWFLLAACPCHGKRFWRVRVSSVGCCQSGEAGAFPVVRQCGVAGCSGSGQNVLYPMPNKSFKRAAPYRNVGQSYPQSLYLTVASI